MFQETATVLWNRRLAAGYFRIGMAVRPEYEHAVPGQFAMLRLSDRPEPLLRRPFSIHRQIRSDGRWSVIEILYRVVGTMTRALSAIDEGRRIDLIGPLGRGFSIPGNCRKVYIAGGGIGIAPLLFLAEFLLKNRVAPEAFTVFIGGRSQEDVLCAEDFRQLGVSVVTTTDDGSTGDQCLITHPLEEAVRRNPPEILYACGPPGMLDCVCGISETLSVPCQVSVEAMMGCGIGACLGCAVESRGQTERYLHACLDGPVFEADQVKFTPDGSGF